MTLFVGLFGGTPARAEVQLLEDIPFGREAVQKAIDAKAKAVSVNIVDPVSRRGVSSSIYRNLLENESVEDFFNGRLATHVFNRLSTNIENVPLNGRFAASVGICGYADGQFVDLQWTVSDWTPRPSEMLYVELVAGKIQNISELYHLLRKSTYGWMPIRVEGLGWVETLAGWYNPYEKTSSLIPFTSTENGSSRGCGMDGVRNGYAYLPINVLTEDFGAYVTDSIVRLYGSESKDPADMVEIRHRFSRVGGVELLPPLQPAARTIAGGNTNESPRSRLRLWIVGKPGETLALQKAASLDGGGWETTQNVQIDPRGTGIEYIEVPNTGTFGIFRIRPPSGGP